MDEQPQDMLWVHRVRAIRGASHGEMLGLNFESYKSLLTPDGFVLLFDQALHPIQPANLFLYDRCYAPNRAGKWQNTQAAYADDLAQWWTFLRVNDLRWEEITSEDIGTYASVLASAISPKTCRRLDPGTISRRVGTVEQFYRWAYANGLIQKNPAASRERKDRHVAHDRNARAHVGGIRVPKRSMNRTKRGDPDEHVNPISTGDLALILNQLGSSPYNRSDDDARPQRDRLIAETALYTGMRVEEVVGLKSHQILDLRNEVDSSDPWKPVLMKITVTKGGSPRKIVLPSFLLQALLTYIDTERASVFAAANARRVTRRQSSGLFLNGVHSNARDIANPVTEDTVMRAFTAAVKSCGLRRTIDVYELDQATGQPLLSEDGSLIEVLRTVNKHTFHDLRQTFAVLFYKSEIIRGNPAPIKKLQARLGHKWMSTTEKIYLAHVESDEHELTDEFARLLRSELDALS